MASALRANLINHTHTTPPALSRAVLLARARCSLFSARSTSLLHASTESLIDTSERCCVVRGRAGSMERHHLHLQVLLLLGMHL